MNFLKKFFKILISIILIVFLLGFGISAYATYTRPAQYVDIVDKYAKENNLDPLLSLSIIKVESNFNPDATSDVGAVGLMQVMPDTAKSINEIKGTNFTKEDLRDPEKNIQIGSEYISYLINHFNNKDLAFAAYNGGIGNVNSWLSNESYSKDGKTLDSIPSSETKYYVVKVNNQYDVYNLFYKGEELRENMNKSPKTWIKNYFKILKDIIKNY
ncbi:MAG: lytic transglycosylase domain-containing protein [Finegoldia sp.]|nr:lytic transglycosylase domain-containing protein [Finegoldia sp.]